MKRVRRKKQKLKEYKLKRLVKEYSPYLISSEEIQQLIKDFQEVFTYNKILTECILQIKRLRIKKHNLKQSTILSVVKIVDYRLMKEILE